MDRSKLILAAAGLAVLAAAWFGIVAPARERARNLRQATAVYDSLAQDMQAEEAAARLGTTAAFASKHVHASDFGISGRRKCVTLTVYILGGTVARVEMTWHYDRKKTNPLIAEKGMSRAEWEASPVNP